MPSVHKVSRSPYWYASFYKPDGRRTLRSTGTTSKREAQGIALELDKASKHARRKRLTVKRAREAIAACYAIAHQDDLPDQTTREFLASWLKAKEGVIGERSHAEYTGIVAGFVEFLGKQADEPMDTITPEGVRRYRDRRHRTVSATTVNKALTILGSAWKQAERERIISDNVFATVDPLDASDVARRRAFTLDEIKRVLAVASGEWRGIILTGLYTGLRLRDVVELTWQQVDLAEGIIRKTTGKTGRTVEIPIAAPLLEYFTSLSATDDPDQWVFPESAAFTSNALSHQFTRILASVGMAVKKPHTKAGKGRRARREANPLSFHCLRHTATSWLKNAGVSDAIARDIIGHESEAISRVYTHIDVESKRSAVGRMPDVS